MNEGFQNRLFRVFTIVLVLLVLVGGMVLAWPKFSLSRELKRKDAELARKIEEKKLEIAELQSNQRRFRTDSEFVEAIARKQHRVFPGELVFIFDDK